MGQFKDGLKLEERFYRQIFKPYLNNRNTDSIFIHFNSNNIVYENLQKLNDIDIILDNGKENITLSLKTQRKKYISIFFETISNCNKNTPGWGYYSKADYILYSMGNFKDGFIGYLFKIKDVLILNIKSYPIGYGETHNKMGILLYKTEGRLIPLINFKNKKIIFQPTRRLLLST